MGGEGEAEDHQHPTSQEEGFPASPSSSTSTFSVPESMIPQGSPPFPRDLRARLTHLFFPHDRPHGAIKIGSWCRSIQDEDRWASSYFQLMRRYEESHLRWMAPVASNAALRDSIDDLRSYKPGDWMDKSGRPGHWNYDIPSTTTLLLVGPRGSGKSSLVNRISWLFEDGMCSDRAQVSHNLSATQGTCFLQEYMMPRQSNYFCVFDTRSLSEDPSDNLKLLKKWMTRGVRHGEMILRKSDSSQTKERMKALVRHGDYAAAKRTRVDFVIFVVNGISVLNSMFSRDKAYIDNLVETFNYPFLSFRDSKPAVVVTHGDGLSFHDRAQVCAYLGELLGIPPSTQIFDIPLTADSGKDYATDTDSVIVEMLHYTLEQADRNFALEQNLFQVVENIFHSMIHELEDSNRHATIIESFIESILVWMFIFAFLMFLKW